VAAFASPIATEAMRSHVYSQALEYAFPKKGTQRAGRISEW